MRPLTSALVIVGLVALATALNAIAGAPGQTIAAQPGPPPTREAVAANTAFALDLYHKLAAADGKNVFFSPYSVSVALAMVTEGARGETADQLARALHVPKAGAGWDVGGLNRALAALHDRFNAASRPAPKELTEKIAALRAKLTAANRKAEGMAKLGKFREQQAAAAEAQKLAAALNPLLLKIDPYELAVANALWGEKTYGFREEYARTIADHYKTGAVVPVDFRGNPDGARAQINAWVAARTRDRIKELVPEKALTDRTRLVLTNAVYFRGEWVETFDKDRTQPGPFTRADGTKVQVPLMRQDGNPAARYAAFNADGSPFATPARVSLFDERAKPALYPERDGFELLEMPYKGDDLSMVLIAPRSSDGLPALEKLLTPEGLTAWVGKLTQRRVNVVMPRFKLETAYGLNDPLQALGIRRAFTDPRNPKAGAQFNGISVAQDPENMLYITKVLHKAFVEVNEKGTEAAAATAVIMAVPSSAPATQPFVPTFRADRPFLFLIRDRHTGTVLFFGRMTTPPKA